MRVVISAKSKVNVTVTPDSPVYFEEKIYKGEKGDTGATGPQGSNGVGVPIGGTAGQILAKIDSTNYNTQWIDNFALPALTSGSVLFSNGTTIAQDNANFFFDNTNKRLGIGTATPAVTFDVTGIGRITNGARFNNVGIAYGPWGQNPLEIGTNGSHFIIQATNGGNTSINSVADLGAKLGIKVGGAASTDIALRIRNSENTADLLTFNGLGGLNITSSIGAANDRPISVGGSTGDIFYIRGFGDGFLKAGLYLGAIGGNNFITDGRLGIRSNQGTGTAFINFTHNNGNTAFTILSNSDIQLNPVAGKVGIGTTTPQQALDVFSATNYQNILVRGNAAPSIGFVQTTGTTPTWKIGISGNFGNNLAISSGAANTDLMTFGATGVGIGITNATSSLYIKGAGSASSTNSLTIVNSLSRNLLNIRDDGRFDIGSTLTVSTININSSGENRFKLFSTAEGTDSLQFYTNGGVYGSSYGEFGYLFKDTATQMASINFDTRTTVAPFRFFVNPASGSAIDAMDIFRTGEIGINTTNTNLGGKLQIKAGGAASTDVALRIRNSGNTGDLISVTGNGVLTVGGTGSDGTINLARGSNGAIIGAIIQTSSITQIHNYQGSGFDFYVAAASNLQRFIVRSTGVGIAGTTGGFFTLDASAALQINSTIQGFLPSRMTNAQRLAIATPAVGLIVYCTDNVEGLYINKSTGWTFVI